MFIFFIENKESTIESDIYSFGICALEMAIHKGLIDFARSLNPDISTPVIDQEVIQKALDQLEDEQQKVYKTFVQEVNIFLLGFYKKLSERKPKGKRIS